MNDIMSNKLNKQAVWFVMFHTLFIFNLAFDILEFM